MVVEGVMSGMHRSPYQGMAVEFAEHRQYVAGDDLKHLDWKVFGRSDKLYIKQYQQETNLDIILMVDASASMGFGTMKAKAGWGGTDASRRGGTWTKFDHATATAVAIAYLCLNQQDRVGVAVFADELKSMVKRSSSTGQWRSIVNTLNVEPVQEKTDFVKITDQVLSKITNRALFVIVSDLFDDAEHIRQALARFRYKNHDVILLHTMDRQEMTFDFTQAAPFEGMEGEGKLRLDPRALRNAYLEAVEKHIESVSKTAGALDLITTAWTRTNQSAQHWRMCWPGATRSPNAARLDKECTRH